MKLGSPVLCLLLAAQPRMLPAADLPAAAPAAPGAAAPVTTATLVDLDIPAQPIRTALRMLGRQAHLQILLRSDEIPLDRISTPGVRGRMTSDQALQRMLANTGLAYDFVNARTVRISNAARAPMLPAGPPGREERERVAADVPPLPEQAEPIQTVSVSASRIQITGYEQPTPVTVVGTPKLRREARVDVGDVIRQLPSFGGSPSPNNSSSSGLVTAGVQGLNLVSLRNLGTNRTLVLFDGQRVVASSIQGGIDISTMPVSLVERIDVVTGGASAAWGSDAVAGVVNVIVNKGFSGLQVNVEDSDNWSSAHALRKAEVSFGTGFADDRGHLILSGSIIDAPDTFFSRQAEGYRSQRLVSNPAFAKGNGQPKLLHADEVGLVTATPGGIITEGPLKGTYFTGPNATAGIFNYGNISENYFTNGGTRNTGQGDLSLNAIPYRNGTGFALGSFAISDSVTASLQLNYGHFGSINNSYSDIQYGTLTISADNPFVPQSVRSRMQALGLTSFRFGTQSLNNMDVAHPGSLQDEAQTLGIPVIDFHRNLYRGVLSLDGRLAGDWSWNAYYQHGESRSDFEVVNNQQNSRYQLAVDAVVVTPANVGASELPLGSIVCRSTLTNPSNGCAPLNVFGEGVASAAAIQYVNAVARSGGDAMIGILKEDVASASAQGTLPLGFDAGPISIAFGAEYRREEGTQKATPAAQASTFQLGNFKNFYGKYSVGEAFLEFNAPILRDLVVESLSADIAGRITQYSTSGTVETFKAGLTAQLTSDVKLRTSYSYDIRAPGLVELFNTGTPVTGGAIDPRTGQGVSVFDTTEGNPNLKPEKAATASAGAVLTPRWLRGLNLSVDYYSIDLKRAISSFSAQTILSHCVAGDQLFCRDLVFDGPNGALSEILIEPLNSDSLKVSGLDFAADYRTYFLAGAIDVSALANYTFAQTQTSLGASFDFAGSLGLDSPYQGVPKLKGQLALTYAESAWSATAQLRVVGAGHLVSSWGPADVDDNDIPAMYYLDLRGAYTVANGVQLYGAIDNLADRSMPVVPPSAAASTNFEPPFRDDVYDGFGRVWRVGIRAKL